METLTVIQKEDLPNLKKLYEVEKPLHVVTTVVIGHFLKRFQSKPEWTKVVTFLSLDESWKQTATFAMVNTHDDHIFVNTLEPSPYKSLRRILEFLNYDKPMVFICFREIFRPVILDAMNIKNLQITFDVATRNIYYTYPDIDMEIEAPKGFYFDALDQRHVEQMSSMWNQEYSLRPQEYLSNCITHNPSTGLFKKDSGELIAWCMMLETGASGNFLVIDKYRRKGLGEAVIAMQVYKVKELGYEITGHHTSQNTAAFNLMKNMGGQWIDNNSWIGIRPKQPATMGNRTIATIFVVGNIRTIREVLTKQ